ncbi:glycosyltransferase family 2 protein [Niabella yanshanensis]|uniref:Glycosyltransferase family 2 protein n=1 Tax=Niabella yanshanensis TaxID=577386 RepID=A0ABZ0W5D8_9BACT|nr:glycosyltransferase family 2 protein [Niabella yanshanensis]WQD37335.1 glycosyltransferase family 2 protein [Niabella yanshanensis]
MAAAPLISICIPAYQRIQFLERLFHSIVLQEYKDFEVIVTDDSPDNGVALLCEKHASTLPLFYFKNEIALGTPANWNKAISLAKGSWIKLMHDDDWFGEPTSLQQFADCAKKSDKGFIFSAYKKVFEDGRKEETIYPEKFRLLQAEKEPAILLAKNFIGPPSVTMYKNDGQHIYDTKLKWLVDIDAYRRRLETDALIYINQPLIKVYMSSSQVTSYTKNVGKIEIPEHFHFISKMGVEKLTNILVYDYNWRFIRNFNIKCIKDIQKYGYDGEVPPILNAMIKTQSRLPKGLLHVGFFSKFAMMIHFFMNRKLIRKGNW